MRILLVTARYLPNRGGLETVVHEIADQMRQAGHTVAIVTNHYPRTLASSEVIDQIPVSRLHFMLPRWKYLTARRPGLWLAAWFFFPISIIGLFRTIRKFRPDIVNVHYLSSPAFFVWLLHKPLRFPLVVSLHGGDVDGEPHENRFNRWLFQAVCEQANQITACSQVLLTQALKLAPTNKSKAEVVHNGVDVGRFMEAKPYAHPQAYILGIGQLVRHKGFDLLIGAFAQIAEQWPAIDLLLAGGGPASLALADQAAATGLGKRIHLLGPVDHQQVASLMRGSLAIVIPSRREPFGIVGLEAMASGRPVIASQIDGLIEAMAGADVSWFASENQDALSQRLHHALSRFTDDPLSLDGRVNVTNQNKAREQSWQNVATHYLATYRNCL